MIRKTSFAILFMVGVLGLATRVGAQLASRPAPDWILRLERPERIAGLKIDYIIPKLDLKPGQVVADLGAGPGGIRLPTAKGGGARGKGNAAGIDPAVLPESNIHAEE